MFEAAEHLKNTVSLLINSGCWKDISSQEVKRHQDNRSLVIGTLGGPTPHHMHAQTGVWINKVVKPIGMARD